MIRVLLVNRERIPHYRVAVYNYLAEYLLKRNFLLTVVAEGVQEKTPDEIHFDFVELQLSFRNLARLLVLMRPDVIIFWTSPRFTLLLLHLLTKIRKSKVIHWGHRRDLGHPRAIFKNLVYDLEHFMDDAIILYAEHMRKQMRPSFQNKIFVANNTLNLSGLSIHRNDKDTLKKKLGITTGKTIICMGRIQKRKRIDDLIAAFHMLDMPNVGLILAGPDDDGLLSEIKGGNIYKPGPVYGAESLEYLLASDVYCLPGAIGLSIVDALFCGLPVITERVSHGPEIMYFKDGVNGFMVDKGDTVQLSARLRLLLTDDDLREKFSQAALREILTNGHIDRMCEGFIAALCHVYGKTALGDDQGRAD
jgi:glycosyltransferase involved in cell wall biosynthesis